MLSKRPTHTRKNERTHLLETKRKKYVRDGAKLCESSRNSVGKENDTCVTNAIGAYDEHAQGMLVTKPSWVRREF